MRQLGIMYSFGQGVQRDEIKAFEWFKKGADLKNTAAMFQLAKCYENGNGVKKNKKRAFHYFLELAQLGDVHAMCEVGLRVYSSKRRTEKSTL